MRPRNNYNFWFVTRVIAHYVCKPGQGSARIFGVTHRNVFIWLQNDETAAATNVWHRIRSQDTITRRISTFHFSFISFSEPVAVLSCLFRLQFCASNKVSSEKWHEQLFKWRSCEWNMRQTIGKENETHKQKDFVIIPWRLVALIISTALMSDHTKQNLFNHVSIYWRAHCFYRLKPYDEPRLHRVFFGVFNVTVHIRKRIKFATCQCISFNDIRWDCESRYRKWIAIQLRDDTITMSESRASIRKQLVYCQRPIW